MQANPASFITPHLEKGRAVAIIVKGVSMLPFIFPRDTIIVRPLAKDEVLTHGTPIVFTCRNKLVAHRLIRLPNGTLSSQGDSCLQPDRLFKTENILGVIVGRRRWGLTVSTVGVMGRLWVAYLFRFAPYSYKLNHSIARTLVWIKKRIKGINKK